MDFPLSNGVLFTLNCRDRRPRLSGNKRFLLSMGVFSLLQCRGAHCASAYKKRPLHKRTVEDACPYKRKINFCRIAVYTAAKVPLSLPPRGRWHFCQKMPEGVSCCSAQFGLEKQPDYQLSASQHTQINADLEKPEQSLVFSPMIHNREKRGSGYDYKRQSGE